MKVKTLNKAMILALLSLSLAACTSNTSQQTSPDVNTDQVENSDDNTNEIVEEAKADNDMENTDIKENKTDDDADKTTTIEVKKSDSKENKDKNTADKKESTDKKDSSKALDKNSKEKDGVYSSSLMSEKNGEREAELQTASVYDILAEEGKLTVKGSIDYQVDLNDYKNLEELENNSYTFKIDENTEFLSGGGMANPTYYKTLEEFNNFYKEVKNSGLGLVITVKDGLVKSVLITS
ncbi:hypothetical protein [Anaerococcus sp. Marseille-P3625]|uniref:hypothetical protein n=1 Tax=Anaerococcus sp. Marseille-P3625 TaxID=1977277 RepID=UPI000C08328A|nr:hypothetical protein [Anaerococcus sp. Marseille-P3625]